MNYRIKQKARFSLVKLFSLLFCIPSTTLGEPGLGDFVISPSPELLEWYEAGEFIDIRGQSIYFQTMGEGPALLLIHGYPYSSYDYHLIAKGLSKTHKVILFDLPGMGFSDKPQNAKFSFEAYADLVNDLLVHLGIEEVDILGHDLGTSVLQELVARGSQNRVVMRSAAFMNGGLFSDTYKPRIIQRLLSQSPDWIGGLISANLTRNMVEGSVARLFGPDYTPDQTLLDDWWGILNHKEGKSIGHRLGRLVFDKVHYQERWISAMQRTKVPMVYLCGPADPNSGLHMAEKYRTIIPHSSVRLLSEKIGHWPQLEAPDEVLGVYHAFLATIMSDSGSE